MSAVRALFSFLRNGIIFRFRLITFGNIHFYIFPFFRNLNVYGLGGVQTSLVHCAHDNSMIEHIAFTKATEGSYCYALLVLFVGEDGSEPLITWLGFGAEPRLISVSSPSPELNIWVFLLHCTLSWSIHLTLDPNYPYWAVIHVDLLACCIE